jgi:hypothetical protein
MHVGLVPPVDFASSSSSKKQERAKKRTTMSATWVLHEHRAMRNKCRWRHDCGRKIAKSQIAQDAKNIALVDLHDDHLKNEERARRRTTMSRTAWRLSRAQRAVENSDNGVVVREGHIWMEKSQNHKITHEEKKRSNKLTDSSKMSMTSFGEISHSPARTVPTTMEVMKVKRRGMERRILLVVGW